MEDKVIVVFRIANMNVETDIEIPLNISANELIYGLNQAFHLRINMDNPDECYLRMENPIGLIRGDTILNEYGIRNGSVLVAREAF